MKILMTAITLFVLTLSFSATAKVFSVKKSSTRTQFPCPISRGGCFEEEMEDLAKDKCYAAGYDTCVTIEKDTSNGKGGQGICGAYRVWHCVVRVRGVK